MSAAPHLLPRSALSASSVGAAASVAVSSPESTVTDAKHLLALGCTCRRAAGAFAIEAARLAVEVERGEQPDTGAAAQMAQSALDLEHAAQHLQADAQDAQLLALLVHRERFPLLLRMVGEMDRGVTFVPAEPVSVGPMPLPRDVVVVGQDDAATPRGRVGRVLARLKRSA